MNAQSAPGVPATLRILLLLILSGGSSAGVPSTGPVREFAEVLRLEADAVHGEQVFDTCAACHGSKGAGVGDGTVPAIAGQHYRVIVWELVSFRHGLRLDSRMQHFTDPQHLDRGTRDIADVAAFVSHLRQAICAYLSRLTP